MCTIVRTGRRWIEHPRGTNFGGHWEYYEWSEDSPSDSCSPCNPDPLHLNTHVVLGGNGPSPVESDGGIDPTAPSVVSPEGQGYAPIESTNARQAEERGSGVEGVTTNPSTPAPSRRVKKVEGSDPESDNPERTNTQSSVRPEPSNDADDDDDGGTNLSAENQQKLQSGRDNSEHAGLS